MSELEEEYVRLREKVAKEEAQNELDEIRAKHASSQSSEPIKIETEGVFDPSLLDSAGHPLPLEAIMDDGFFDDPMGPIMKMLSRYLDSLRPRTFEPVKSEHKVKIFRLPKLMAPAEIESVERAIEALLNDGYCCHMPVVCNDYVIMDFSRRKETEENEREH